MDRDGTLFGTLRGNSCKVLREFTIGLPSKQHGGGDQSADTCAPSQKEIHRDHVQKTAELARDLYIDPATSKPNVTALILAVSTDVKTELGQSEMFDPRLQARIIDVFDVSCGGDIGLNQAIRLLEERMLIMDFCVKISKNEFQCIFGVYETMRALELGVVETLIVWEYFPFSRFTLKNTLTGDVKIRYLNRRAAADPFHLRDYETDTQLEIQDRIPLLVWLENEYKRFGIKLEVVSVKTEEGLRFWRGFLGIGAILRYPLDITWT